MPGIREIPLDTSMDSLWEECVYTLVRLRARAITRELAAPFDELLGRIQTTETTQRAHWQAESAADAAVEVADEDLDEVTDDVIAEVRHADRKAESDARENQYLGTLTLRGLTRLGLASQMARMRTWVTSLESEPEDSLKKLAKRLVKVFTAGGAAIDQRVEAASARAAHRAREITSLVADVNATRRDTYGALVRIAAKNKRPKDWPERFFLHSSKSVTAVDPTPPAPPTT